MKKLIIIIMSCIILSQSFAIYKLYNKPTTKITKEVITAEPQKIIYKDKIIYKTNPTDEKIIFQTKMFLHLLINNQNKCTNADFFQNFWIENTEDGMNRALDNTINGKDYILNDITEYNKSHAGKND